MRILRLDGVVKLREPAIITSTAVEPIFVTDLNVGQLEWFGMTILRPARAPLGGLGVADEILDFFERFLHVRFERRTGGNHATAAEAVAGENTEHWLHVQVFAPLGEFQQPQTVGGPVTPATGMTGTLFYGAKGFLPDEP